jgi:NADH dehydrogenase
LHEVERVHVQMARMLRAEAWHPLLAGIDVVVNCAGILRPRWGESYDAVHHTAVAALAGAAASARIRLIHISALGLRADAQSGFIRSKWNGEQALLRSDADAVIVRPSLLDGEDGFGARWLRKLARWPVQGVPHDAVGRIAPLDVDDLADALVALCEQRESGGPRVVELGGADTRTMAEHLAALRRAQRADAARVYRVPGVLARGASHLCDLLHLTPFSFGHLELMRRDNAPQANSLVALIGRAPRWIGVRNSARADATPASSATASAA